MTRRLIIYGCGKMARCMLPSIVKHFPSTSITATRRTQNELDKLHDEFSIGTTTSNTDALKQEPDYILLAAKPQQIPDILDSIAKPLSQFKNKPSLVSIAAGLAVSTIEKHLGDTYPILRVMPNTSVLVGEGMTGLYANPALDQETYKLFQSIFNTVGETVTVEKENQLDLITAVSGCGPAYFYLFGNLLAKEAAQAGLSVADTQLLVRQTLIGVGKTLKQRPDSSLRALRKEVTSKGGVTEAAIGEFKQDLPDAIHTAFAAAMKRSDELSGNKLSLFAAKKKVDDDSLGNAFTQRVNMLAV